MISAHPESGHRGNLPQHNKDHIQQPTANITFTMKKRKHFLYDQE